MGLSNICTLCEWVQLWKTSTKHTCKLQIAHLPYQSLLPGVDEDEFIGLLRQKITLLIFPTSNRSPSPPFRINFTVSVTEKVGTNKKLPPMAVPVHPLAIQAQDPVIVNPPFGDLNITQFGWIGNPSSFTCQYIINLVVGKSVDWNRRALHLYWTRVRKPTRPYKHISSATFSKQQFQLNLHLLTKTTHVKNDQMAECQAEKAFIP